MVGHGAARVYGMLADYADQNDHDAFRSDPIFKVIAGRAPSDPKQDLASQPTLSRFENDVSIADLNRLWELFVTLFIESFSESLGVVPPQRITLDLDAWDDETCEELRLFYTFGYGMNPVLKRHTDELLQQLQEQFAEASQPQREFVCWQYQARSWSAPRCTIVKVEAKSEGTNRRVVLTNRPGGAILPGGTYDEYADRGESENRHKELKRELHGDRLSRVDDGRALAAALGVGRQRLLQLIGQSEVIDAQPALLHRYVVLMARSQQPNDTPFTNQRLWPLSFVAGVGHQVGSGEPSRSGFAIRLGLGEAGTEVFAIQPGSGKVPTGGLVMAGGVGRDGRPGRSAAWNRRKYEQTRVGLPCWTRTD